MKYTTLKSIYIIKKLILLAVIFLMFFSSLNAYESENKLEVVIIGKVAKFITWEKASKDFVITVLDNPYGSLFNEIFNGKKVHDKNIVVKYINNMDELGNTNILYIPTSKANELSDILEKVKGKNILTVSNIRGFAEKKGILQIYFVSQKVKLKINLFVARNDDLRISSTLLRIVDVIKGDF